MIKLKNKNLIILGGSGFIGMNIVKYYSDRNIKVFATYNKSKPKIKSRYIKWIKIDLLKENEIKKLLKNNNFKYLIQCAATTAGVQSMKSDPFSFISGNAIMNSLLIKWCVHFKVEHFIFLSCTVMYRNSKTYLKETQFNIEKYIHPSYEGIAFTKVYLENICKFYAERSVTKFTALRHSNVYGPYDKFNNSKGHFMSSIITKTFKKNKSLEIWGDGSEKRDFLYIDDFLDGINLLFSRQKKNFEIFNMSSGKSYPLKKIVKKIVKITNKRKKIIYLKNKPTIKINILVNNKKIFNKIGWKPKTSIDKGIKETINWYQEFYNQR